MGRAALLHENDARHQARHRQRRHRRELQRKFPPGALGVYGATTFTVVGWSPTAPTKALPAQAPEPGRSFWLPAVEAQPAGWGVAVLMGQRLETWSWRNLKHCKTLAEWAGEDAVP